MSGSNVTDLLQQILSRLSIIEDKVGASGGSSASATDSQALPPRIAAFDAYCTANLNPFVDACNKLGGDAAASGNNLKEAWMEMRNYLLMACHCKEPSQADMMTLLKPVIAKMSATKTFENRNEWINHTKAISEGMSCLNWLCIKPAPREQVESTIGGSDYWANNIRKEYKNTNPDHIAFCNTFKTVLSELCVYIKEHHTTGVTWNPKGVDAKDYDGKSAGVGAAPAAAAPVAAVQKSAPTATVAKADLFAALNKDSAITSGLKKVTKDMQTWRSEYKGGDAPAAAPVAAAPKPAAAKKDLMKYPPKCDFDAASNKWQVEYQTAEQGVVSIEIKDKKETVYILGCVGATINITGKCKSIVVDSCKRTKVMFQSAMASCEVVNCQRVQIVCGETVAAVAIDKTDGIVVTLPRSSLNTEVVASKSSEMNLSWPDENGEMVEKPIPEQYVHRIQGMSVTANVSDLYTH